MYCVAVLHLYIDAFEVAALAVGGVSLNTGESELCRSLGWIDREDDRLGQGFSLLAARAAL